MVVTATAAKRLTPTTENNNTKIEIEIDKDKLSLISHALKHSNNKTVVEYVTETLDGLHGRVSESIKTVQI